VAFTQKLIEIQVTLAQNAQTTQPNTFVESGTDSVTISGTRISCEIVNAGATIDQRATIRAYGLTPSLMNQMSTLGMAWNIIPKNSITILAGDDTGMSVVFTGTITLAYAEYDKAPNPPFVFECVFGLINAVQNAQPSSFTGPTQVSQIMQGLASSMGFGFQNNGVTATLSNPYYPGSYWQQAQQVAQHAGISYGITAGGILTICPKGATVANQAGSTPIIAPPPEGEMIGYPAFTQQGIIVKNLWNPQFQFLGLINVQSSVLNSLQSSVPTANFPSTGNWGVYKLDHHIESLVPDGNWMSTLYCWNPQYNKSPPSPTSS
jgi:hypothetical protein